MKYEVHTVGKVRNHQEGVSIQLDADYIPALKALDGFHHILVLWWCSELDDPQYRTILEINQPYQHAPQKMGIFATRSPVRPNPIAVSVAQVLDIDYEKGIIHLPYIDANDKTPILDIKPYTPSLDRVEAPGVPSWCQDWPMNIEDSGAFDWSKVFKF